MAEGRVNAPYQSLVSDVRQAVGYIPFCTTKEGRVIFSAGEDRVANAEKLTHCASCLVRLECLTDGVNSLLITGAQPTMNQIAGFQAGFTKTELVAIGVGFYKRGVTTVTIDDIEDIPL